ncbi:MAG: response regulator [Vulcanimicrobiota bacterium]
MSGESILVVEDDATLRDDLKQALEGEGYEVVACEAGLRALELAEQQSFALLVTDVRMAGLSGLDTIERLQQSQPMVATLVITGYTDEASSIRAVRLGVGDYLKKPFRLDEFLQAVSALLAQQRGRRKRWLREQNLAKTALWVLESWLGSQSSQEENIRRARWAAATALQLGLSAELAEFAQRCVLIGGCLDLLGAQADLQGLPADVVGVLEELRSECPDRETWSLVTQIAQVAQGQTVEANPSVLEAFERVRQQTQPQGLSSQRRTRLRLAQGLEASQQCDRARQAYQELLEAEPDRTTVDAHLGLMRLSGREMGREFARQAVETARSLNPVVWAVASLEAGLALGGQGYGYPRESELLLRQALKLAGELGLGVVEAKAGLALADLSAERDWSRLLQAVEFFLQSEALFELLDCSNWIIPCLVRFQRENPQPALSRLLARIGREAPARMVSFLEQSADADSRLVLAEALGGSSHPAAQEALNRLSRDADSRLRAWAERSGGGRPADPPAPLLRIYCLGGFEVWRGDEQIPTSQFRSWKQRFLLARLAVSGRPIPGELLMDEFWPDDLEGGRASLNVTFGHLRRLLRPPSWPVELDYVVRDQGRLSINPKLPVWHDLNELNRWAHHPDDGSEAQLEAWRQVVQLYRGPYLENCYMDWALQHRERCETLVQETLRRLVAALLERNRPREVLDYGARLLELDPCCQDSHLAVMKAYLQLQRPQAAVRQFEACKKALKQELGMEPSIALLEYHQRALLAIP